MNEPNWDKITEGKIRHGFALASFTRGDKLDNQLIQDIEAWVRYVVDGIEWVGFKGDDLPDGDDEPLFPEPTASNTFDSVIRNAVKELKAPDADKVINALESGKITEQNLDECLQKISDIKDGYGEL